MVTAGLARALLLAILGALALVPSSPHRLTSAAGLLCKATLLKIETGTLVWDIMTMGNAALAGLVAITSGCSVILPWVSLCACGATTGWTGCVYLPGGHHLWQYCLLPALQELHHILMSVAVE